MTSDNQFVQTNIAIWILTATSAAFLFVRLWCRLRFSKLWWDDYVLTTSWLILLVSCALLSCATSVGYETDEDQKAFFRFHDTSTSMTTLATCWTKVAFAITLTRISQNRALTYFLWVIIVTANLILVPGLLSIWIPCCEDPRRIYRSEQAVCWPLRPLQYLGGTTIVYGGVIDVLLALCPWIILRKLMLVTREKIGLTIAMSLGAFTGVIVILRAFYQFNTTDNTYDFVIFIGIFNFLEPAVTIMAQTIPIFRVLFIRVKRGSQNGVRINSLEGAFWESKVQSNPEQNQEVFHVRVGPGGRIIQVSESYDGGNDA